MELTTTRTITICTLAAVVTLESIETDNQLATITTAREAPGLVDSEVSAHSQERRLTCRELAKTPPTQVLVMEQPPLDTLTIQATSLTAKAPLRTSRSPRT